MEEIRNKVDESGLIQLDLEHLIKTPTVLPLDIAELLEEGFFLREKPFRQAVKELDASPYTDKAVALYCSTDAILPLWSWMLLTIKLTEVGAVVYQSSVKEAREALFLKAIDELPIDEYQDGKVIVKGCSDGVPVSAYSRLSQRLSSTVKSLMFGEACSAVPIFKAKK
jgi:flavin-dependent dehydrogenase